MKKLTFLLILTIILYGHSSIAQKKAEVFTSKFISQNVTYNASPKPSECWEAVEWGIKIPHNKTFYFFSMDQKNVEKVKTKVGDEEVQIEVIYYKKASEGGAVGSVSKVTFKGEVIFENK